MNAELSLAYSPCPNDTFIFGALATGQIEVSGLRFDIRLHDVQTLNERVLAEAFDVSKVSIHAYLKARERYVLLDAGAAVGFGCGPLVVAKARDALANPAAVRIAVPGEWTTANLLLRLWNPAIAERIYLPYDQIMAAVLDGRADAGVIIHESRFVYRESGLRAIVDLGEWWEAETGLPIPLGGIVARHSLGHDMHWLLETTIRQSIEAASRHPETVAAYVRAHARELSASVLDRHVAMFVNAFSLRLGRQGQSAIDRLSAMMEREGMLP